MLLLLGADAMYAELQMLCVSRTCAVAMGALILCDVDALAEKMLFLLRMLQQMLLLLWVL